MSDGVDSELNLDFVRSSEDRLPHSPRSLDPPERSLDDMAALHTRFVGRSGFRPAVDSGAFGLRADMSFETEFANT